MHRLSYRHLNLILGAYALAMMGIAYFYFQRHLGLLPCPLCVTQRLCTIAFGGLALVAALHNPKKPSKQRGYSALIGACALGGALIAARQVYLQSLPADQAPSCGPTLPYLIEYFPLQDVLRAMLMGEGSCAEIKWQLFGLSIPDLTLAAFALVVVVCIWQLCRRVPS
ncbi:MAG: disulfide bond formation protein B [Cellvibrionales bacterium]|nr:disulfide bond formation protein B [Cellvibrionales bacterium]